MADATAPTTSFTQVETLNGERHGVKIIGPVIGSVFVDAVQLVREEFPYTFPVDFTATQSGVTFQGGNVRLLSG